MSNEQTVAPERDLPDFPVTLVRADGMTTVVKEGGLFVQLMQTGRFKIQGQPAATPEPDAEPETEKPTPAPAKKKATKKKTAKKKATKKKATKKKAKS